MHVKDKSAVVILNFNGKEFLKKFLPVVLEKSPEATLVVADNGSSDDSVKMMKAEFPKVLLLQHEKNLGFAGGYNWALSQVDATYYVLLNSDVEVSDGWLEPLVNMMDADESIAACQPKILAHDDPSHFEYAGASGGFIDRLGYPFCRGRMFETLEKDEGQYNDAQEVFWATGACMMIRASVYHQLGGLDADFFAHMEEIDFCWRAKNAGFKIMVQPASKIFHVGGGTLPKSSPQKTYLNFRNNFMLLYKNLPSSQLTKVFLTRLFLDGLAGIKFLMQGNFKDIIAILNAHFYFYSHLSVLRSKRSELTQRPVSCIYRKSLVSEYYLKGKKYFSALNPEKFS
jgi:hypothetical protein